MGKAIFKLLFYNLNRFLLFFFSGRTGAAMEEPVLFECWYWTDPATIHTNLRCKCSVFTVLYCKTDRDYVGSRLFNHSLVWNIHNTKTNISVIYKWTFSYVSRNYANIYWKKEVFFSKITCCIIIWNALCIHKISLKIKESLWLTLK